MSGSFLSFSSSGVNPVWFPTVALVLVLLGPVLDGLRCDCRDGFIIALETFIHTSRLKMPKKTLCFFLLN